MKKIKSYLPSILGVILTSLVLISCKNLYYQVYDVKSNVLKQKDNSLAYENEDLKILYNLWSEKGYVSFIIQNKTDSNLFINMGQTFFVCNGEAYDYFKNQEYTNTNSIVTSFDYWTNQYYSSILGYWPMKYLVLSSLSNVAKITKGTSHSVTVKEKEIVCIPGRSFKHFSYFCIAPELKVACNRKIDYPSTMAEIGRFTQLDSPLKFENRIAYSFSPEGKNARFVENDFYVSNISNYKEKVAVEKRNVDSGCNSFIKGKKKFFKIGGPNKFYLTYEYKDLIE